MLYAEGKGQYDAEEAALWKRLVPRSGQADTVHGELVRAIGRLASELYRNGNINWNPQFVRLVAFLRLHLLDPAVFPKEVLDQTEKDLAEIEAIGTDPFRWQPVHGEADVYDRVTDRVVEWCRARPQLLAREHDPDLKM
jgi:hypothetical protein